MREQEVVDKEKSESIMKYICPNCGEGYYSAAPLDALHDPTCDLCGEDLILNPNYPQPYEFIDTGRGRS